MLLNPFDVAFLLGVGVGVCAANLYRSLLKIIGQVK